MKRIPIILLITTFAASVIAAPLQQWTFDDPAGTQLTMTKNSVSAGAKWEPDMEASTTTGKGAFRIRRSRGQQANAYAPIQEVASGTAWLQVDIDGWNLTGSGAETVRFAFTSSNPGTASPFVAAQMKLERAGGGKEVVLSGESFGTGTKIEKMQPFDASRTTPLSLLLKFDADAKAYSIFFRQSSGGAWEELGSGITDAGRTGKFIRIGAAGEFATNATEFCDIGAISLTSNDPRTAK
jgi:hypothetical protein